MTRAPDDGRNAFADFVRPYWEPMARLARRLAPPGQWEDVLQEALSAAWRKRAQYDEARGTARSWLLAIVADQAYKGHRRPSAGGTSHWKTPEASAATAQHSTQAWTSGG